MRRPMQRLKKKVQKENLWIFIFHLLKKKDTAVNELRSLIERQHGFLSGNVTAYKVLFLLESGGYVKSYYKGRKKYYKITDRGMRELKEAVRFFEKTWKGLRK